MWGEEDRQVSVTHILYSPDDQVRSKHTVRMQPEKVGRCLSEDGARRTRVSTLSLARIRSFEELICPLSLGLQMQVDVAEGQPWSIIQKIVCLRRFAHRPPRRPKETIEPSQITCFRSALPHTNICAARRSKRATALKKGSGKKVAVCGPYRMIRGWEAARAAAPWLVTASLGVTLDHDLQVESIADVLYIELLQQDV
ncbi:hypothetical protein BU25DRAFT_424323 [Macroventuria anomochaeta]|uniref:Uncharacterized protein n=1 Tax=Macroventuria anomochaeta TaxID=301207 RepID=A0ACB6RRB1_9PLEO|nr:uncharacterized protein BU25DRAFT_424323 [Macroventuria anomochaeta]KAF2624242.1 hypothetical protein BU25DRAFT_424323 [Macroventuria anomochaeta]